MSPSRSITTTSSALSKYKYQSATRLDSDKLERLKSMKNYSESKVTVTLMAVVSDKSNSCGGPGTPSPNRTFRRMLPKTNLQQRVKQRVTALRHVEAKVAVADAQHEPAHASSSLLRLLFVSLVVAVQPVAPLLLAAGLYASVTVTSRGRKAQGDETRQWSENLRHA